ncbi:hypothetical protein J0A65_24215, partial [Bowmanella sp. Y57]|nr:hypothetical protein [Bowmanella yangjiangensis]
GSEKALVEGAIAGHAAVGEHDAARRLWPRRQHWQGFAKALNAAFALRDEVKHLARPETLLCRCEDVPLAAVRDQAGWSQAKMTSRCGMGACQGRVCAAAAQVLFDWPQPAPRSPLSPARIDTLLHLQ